jgi:hypothetical protein
MSDVQSINGDTLVSRTAGMVAVTVEGEIAMLGVEQGRYYSLAGAGSRIWELLESPRRVAELAAILQQEFEVERAVCTAEVLAFLHQCVRERLIQIHP